MSTANYNTSFRLPFIPTSKLGMLPGGLKQLASAVRHVAEAAGLLEPSTLEKLITEEL